MYILNWKKQNKNKHKKTNILYLFTQFYAPDSKYKQKKGRKKKKARYMRIEHIFCTKELFEIEEKMTR